MGREDGEYSVPLPTQAYCLLKQPLLSSLSLCVVDIKCCFRAVLMVCEFVVVRDEVY